MKTYVKALLLSILCSSVAYATTPAAESDSARWVTEVMAQPQSKVMLSQAEKATNSPSMQEFLKKTVTPNNS